MVTSEIESAIIRTLSADERVNSAYLLGSAAQGRLRPDSDVDIALMLAKGKSFNAVERCLLAASLSLELGREVELGLLSSANLVYARQAILTGHRLFARESFLADLRAASLLGMYERFNLDRREVSDAYSA